MSLKSASSLKDTIPIPGTSASMPCIGFGVWQIPPAIATDACVTALEVGYRHIDSAQLYRNEAEVGKALQKSGLKREEVFITTKIGIYPGSLERTYDSVLASVHKIAGEDGYVDLFLLHRWLSNSNEMWRALERLLEEGKAKSIGVSNFGVEQLEEMKEHAKVWPPHVNQIELNPWNQKREVDEYCKKHGIILQAYSPLATGEMWNDPTLVKTAAKIGKTPAQVLVRYCLQKDWVPLPKSVHKERMQENADVFDFELGEDDMKNLDAVPQASTEE